MTTEQKKAVESYAFEKSVDYQPLDDTLPPNDYFRYGIEIGIQEVLSNPSKYGLQPKTEWVSVEDILPEQLQRVWVCLANLTMWEAFYSHSNGWYRIDKLEFREDNPVTHWMLPEPPTETK